MSEKAILSENYEKAYFLDRKIKANARAAQESLYEVCKGLKEMRDGKLYKELGYQNFENYCNTELEITRQQGYNYISIVENLSEDFVNSSLHFGVKKLCLLSKIDEAIRAEIVENTDLSKTSVKELEGKLAELQSRNQELEKESEEYAKIREENQNMQKLHENSKTMISKYMRERDEAKAHLQEAKEENLNLIQQIEELENRPVEVAVAESDSHEIENLKDAMKRVDLDWSQKYNELQEENIKETIANNQKHAAELEQLKAEYEEKLAEAEKVKGETVPDTKEVFRAYLSNAVDAVNRLLDFVGKYPDEELFRSRIHDFFGIVTQRLEAGQNEQ